MTATPIGPGQVAVGHLAWMTIKIGGCGAVYVAVIAAFGGVRSAGDRPGAAGRDARRRGRGRARHGLHRGRRGRGLGVHRAVPAGADPDDAVLRHVLPGRPAAGRRSSRSRGCRRCGTAPSWPGPRRSAAGPHCPPSGMRRSSLRWSRPGRRWPSCASGGGCTDDGAQPRHRAGRSGGAAQPPPLPVLARLLPAGSYAGRPAGAGAPVRHGGAAHLAGDRLRDLRAGVLPGRDGAGARLAGRRAARAGRHADLATPPSSRRACSPRRP